jgi:hypothetical protein
MRTLKIKNADIEFLSFNELAKLCGKSTMGLRKLEYKGILPPPNFRTADKHLRNGYVRKGDRLYSRELSKEIHQILKLMAPDKGKAYVPNTYVKLQEAFKKEKQQYA